MTAKSVVSLISLVGLFGCAPPLQQTLPANHPANPAAEEAPAPAASQSMKREPPEELGSHIENKPASAGHVHPPPAAPTAGANRCPMHSEAHSDEPGPCPKCGMQMRREAP